jgi:hypothetical protein
MPAPGVGPPAPRCPPWYTPCQGVARGTPRQLLASAGGRTQAAGQHRPDGSLGTARLGLLPGRTEANAMRAEEATQ